MERVPEAAQMAARLGGGVVSAIIPSPDATVTAVVWSERDFPMWYRLGLVRGQGDIALTQPDVRLWGRPRWATSGHLAVGGFVGIRRSVFDVDVETAATTPIVLSPDASYELLEYLAPGRALCRRRGLDGSVAVVRAEEGGDVVLDAEGGPLPAWRDAELVRWRAGDCQLEAMLVPPARGEPPWPTVCFLHGGPVAALAAGEPAPVAAWVDARWATFVPEFPASGICGEAAMLGAFEAKELPDEDHEVDAVLVGVDALVDAGKADRSRLFLGGHSYGAYLVNRAVTRTTRFRAAVCCEGVADVRLLDGTSLEKQPQWRGGTPLEAPERWSAASPIERADRVRTPMLLVYGAQSGLVRQGQEWHDALRREGVSSELEIFPGARHSLGPKDEVNKLHDRVAAWFRIYDRTGQGTGS